ncbi:MAG: hypothetical protein WKF90_12160 [Pyrinomonadaceae bacterium]
MKLPISFEEVSYFKNEYRGDLIVTKGVLYYLHIEQVKRERLEFDENSVPKPMRFSAEEVGNARFWLKFKFDAKYDNHDFRVNLIHRKLFNKLLKEGGFMK